MKFCIYGAGAIGGYLAGMLARSGVDVSIIARGAHLAAMQSNGLTVDLGDERFTVPVRATDDPKTLGIQDAVLVTVKAPSLPSVVSGIGALLGSQTPVAFITNGIPWWYFMGHGGAHDGQRLPLLDPSDALWSAVGPARTVGGVFWPASTVPEPGVVRMVSGAGRGTTIGAPDGLATPCITAIAEAFRAAGLPITISPKMRDVIWEKLAFNFSAGPMTVLTTTPVMATQVEPACVAASRSIMAEAAALIAAMGCDVSIDVERAVTVNRTLGHRPSILQDLLAGRPMEIDALYGQPLEFARMMGVPMPTLSLLVALIKVRARAAGLYGG